MKQTLKWLDINFEPLLIMVIFIAMTCLICLQVILRFFMGSGFAWGEEFATFMFVWLCFLGISYAFRNNRQISVDFLRNMLPEKPRKALVLLIDVSMLVLMGLFLYGAVQNVMTAAKYNDMAASVQVSLNVCYTAAVVGYFLSMIRLLQTIVWKIRHFGASYELFENRGGLYSGATKICFMPKYFRDDEEQHMNAELVEEEKKYSHEGGKEA